MRKTEQDGVKWSSWKPLIIRLKDFLKDSVILDPGSNIDFYFIRENAVILSHLIQDQILIFILSEKMLWFCLSWSGIKYWFRFYQRKFMILSLLIRDQILIQTLSEKIYDSFFLDPWWNIDFNFMTENTVILSFLIRNQMLIPILWRKILWFFLSWILIQNKILNKTLWKKIVWFCYNIIRDEILINIDWENTLDSVILDLSSNIDSDQGKKTVIFSLLIKGWSDFIRENTLDSFLFDLGSNIDSNFIRGNILNLIFS